MAKNHRELAENAALHRTIPKKHADIPVTAANGQASLGAFTGQYIYLRAITLDVTIKLGSGNTIAAAGEGALIRVDATMDQEYFVDPSDDLVLNHRSTGAATLRVLHD